MCDPAGRIALTISVMLTAGGTGCTTVPRDPLAIHPQTVAQRQMQTRRFETADERRILQASVGVLLDHGFVIDSTEEHLGVVIGSKDRTAVESQQVMASVAAAVFGADVPFDRRQKIRASIVTQPEGDQVAIRATFQRIVWNSHGYISKREPLNDPEFYIEFFSRLSKSLALEAYEP